MNILLDPMEVGNRARDPACAEIKAGLSAALDTCRAATNDPFPGGNFPKNPQQD